MLTEKLDTLTHKVDRLDERVHNLEKPDAYGLQQPRPPQVVGEVSGMT